MSEIILPVHLLVLTFIGITIIRADTMAFAWMRGITPHLNDVKVKKLHRHMWIGLTLMIITGIAMFFPMREYLLHRVQFFAKMTFVLILVVNGLVIGHLQKKTFNRTYKELTLREKLPLMISGAVSVLAWLGAFAGGFYISEF
jgi:hypothetical protein